MEFTEILDQYRIQYIRGGEHQHVRHGWIGFDCPWCGRGTNKYHAGYNEAGRYVVCWRCGYHRLLDALAELTGKPYWEFKGVLDQASVSRKPKKERPGALQLPKHLGPLQKAHRQYLQRRGFDPDELQRLWAIQGIGLGGRLGWRIWIPVHYHGEVASWTTRAIGNQPSRYISAGPDDEQRPLKSMLYGSDYVRHSTVVVEGPTDVWRIGPGAVALMGMQHTTEQVRWISKVPCRAICFDNEPAAQRRARHLANELHVYPGQTTVVEVRKGKDVATTDEKTLAEIRQLLN